MGAAVAVSALDYVVAKRRGRPLLGPRLEIPTRRDLDARIDWALAALFVVGGVTGGIAGVSLGEALATRKQALGRVFAILVIAVGFYIASRGVIALTA